jgi:hypothetical protein
MGEPTAVLATDENAKRIYTELARQWRQRAEQAEALELRLVSANNGSSKAPFTHVYSFRTVLGSILRMESL